MFFSQTQNLWMYYAASGLMAVGVTMCGWIPLMTALSRWFVRRRATALGVAHMFGPLGTIFLAPLIALSADPSLYQVVLGWRLTAVVLGRSIMVVAVLAFTLLRNRPEDMGLLPDGGPAGQLLGVPGPAHPLFLAHRLRSRHIHNKRPRFDGHRTHVGAFYLYGGLRSGGWTVGRPGPQVGCPSLLHRIANCGMGGGRLSR